MGAWDLTGKLWIEDTVYWRGLGGWVISGDGAVAAVFNLDFGLGIWMGRVWLERNLRMSLGRRGDRRLRRP